MPTRFRRRRRGGGRRKKSTRQLALLALRRAGRARLKFTNALTSVTFNNTWNQLLLNGIALGDADTQRDGDSIRMETLMIRVKTSTNAAVDASTTCRYVVVYDRQANGSILDTNKMFITDNSIISPRDPALDRRYKVLWDRTFTVNEYTANATTSNDRYFSKMIRLRSMRAQYEFDGAAETALSSGSLWFLFLSDRSTNVPFLEVSTMLRWRSTQN